MQGLGGEPGRSGRKSFVATPEQRNNVKILVGLGVPQAMICQLVVNPQTGKPLDEGTLKKHFPREIAVGAAELHARMGSFSERGCGRLPVVTISLLPMECRSPTVSVAIGLAGCVAASAQNNAEKRRKRSVARCYYADRKRSGDNDRGAHRPAAPDALVFGLLIAFSNTILAYSLHAYQSELYPTRIRARAVGFTYSWSRFSTIFVGFFIALFLRLYGTTGVFLFIAGAMIIVFAVIGAMGPRTTGLRLEEISS